MDHQRLGGFIHSCHLPANGTKTLEHLLMTLQESGLLDKLELCYINNVGLKVDKSLIELYNHKHNITLVNYSH